MGNILGEKFDNYVQNQIKVRQESLGKYTNISTKDLLYYQNKTPWLRLASSVDLEVIGRDSNLEKLSRLLEGIDSNDLKDSNLAKKCVLHGGIVDESKPQLQSGLRSPNNIFSGAYGWGGGERGFVPQPGIVGADVTYYNNGALSKCTVNIKCFSREQFAIIDTLYMRPGYTVLLEFGWSLYLSKNGDNIELNQYDQFQSSAFQRFFEGGLENNFEIYDLIEKDRKTYKGNYNGIYGRISKFDWKFNNDGSYDITIQITGMGDIIESLTIPSFTVKENEEEITASKLKSTFHTRLYEYRNIITENLPSDNTQPFPPLPLTIENFDKGEKITLPKSLYSISDIKNNKIEVELPREDYISFGALIAVIQNEFLLYNNDQPVYKFDINFSNITSDENYIISFPLSISSDPTKILVNTIENISKGPVTLFSLLPDDLTKSLIMSDLDYLSPPSQQILPNNFLLLSGIYVSINFVESLLDKHIDSKTNQIELLGIIKDVLNAINSCTGNINDLSIKLNNDEGKWQFINSSPYMLELRKKDKDSISKFNLFGFLPKNSQGGTPTPIQGSFIRDISLTSGITDEWATLISIGAASSSTTNFSNSTSFKLYNKGLKDRILPERNDKVSIKKDETIKKEGAILPNGEKFSATSQASKGLTTNLKESLKELSKYYAEVYNDKNFNEDVISTLKNKYATTSGYLKDYYQNELKANLSFFLPFNLQLTMDGIGGIKLYQRFEMDERILPPIYDGQNIDLIIKGINHSITPAGWTTTLDSLSVPKSTAQ